MKKIVILRFSILGICVFLLCTSIYTFFYSNPERFKVRKEDKKIGDKIVEEDFSVSIEEEATDNKEEEVKENNNNNNNNKVISQPEPTTNTSSNSRPVTITYSCPDNYQLNGTKCYTSKIATQVCPRGTTEYAYNGLSGCVILSEGIETVDGTCPSGQGLIKEIHLGGPDVFKCFTLYDKEYTCDDGFTLSGSNCIKTIDATKTES